MLKTHIYKIIVIVIAMCFCQNSYCQKQTDSLYSYLTIAAQNNPTVTQRYKEYEAALQKIPQVGGLPDPTLSVGIFLQPMELIAGNQQADIRLMQMFPWFGVLRNAKDEMSLMAKAKFEAFRSAKLQTYFDVQKKWYELNKVKQNIRLSEKNIEILQTIERLAIVKYKSSSTGGNNKFRNTQIISTNSNSGSSGMNNNMGGNQGKAGVNTPVTSSANMPGIPMGAENANMSLTDVYRIQIEIGDLQNNIELLKNQLSSFMAEFNAYLNRKPDVLVFLPDSIVADSFQPSIQKITDNPMLSMIHLEQQSLAARKKMVDKMGYPMVGIGLNYLLIQKSPTSTSPMNGNDMIMPMVTTTLPIYRKKYRGMRNEANMLMNASEQNYEATANALHTEYYQAMQQFQDAKRRTLLYANQYQLASKSLNIMLQSFAAANSGLTEILRVQQQTLDYEYRQIEAIADFNTSIARLKQLMAYNP